MFPKYWDLGVVHSLLTEVGSMFVEVGFVEVVGFEEVVIGLVVVAVFTV